MTMVNAFDAKAPTELSETDRVMIARRDRVLGPAYRLFYQNPLHVVRGEGVWLYDAGGRAYLDAYNNVASIGHSHPRIVDAIARQAAILNTHTRYLDESVIACAERLAATLPDAISQVMFTCTGSEANDLALRIARRYAGGEGVIVTENAYHGVTTATAELSPSLGSGSPLGASIRTVPAPDPSDVTGEVFAGHVANAISDMARSGICLAALLVDTVFSSDGLQPEPRGFLRPAVQAVREAGGVFIADEVQAGFCRTGDSFWGFSRHEVEPDIVTMGKPMGNGHPVAAVALRPSIVAPFGANVRYFNTFGGNPVSCAAASAVLDVIEQDRLLENVRRTGAYLRARLDTLAASSARIGAIRSAGLYAGVDILGEQGRDAVAAAGIVNAMRDGGVLISATGKDGATLKIRPPIVFDADHVDILIQGLRNAIAVV